jgi:hypothetical protein
VDVLIELLFREETLIRVTKLEKSLNRMLQKKRKYKGQLWMVILHGLLLDLMQMTLILMLAPFFSDLEPSFFVLKLFFPVAMVKSSWALRILRSGLNGLIATHWISCGTNGALFLLAIINLSTESLRMMGCLSCKFNSRWKKKSKLEVMLIRKLTFSYRQLFIIVDAFNSITRWSFAIALGAGMGTFVLGGSGSVILAGKVNLPTYVLFPLIALTMVGVLMIISPPAEKVDILSSEFIFSFKRNGLEPRPFRNSRAMQPLRIQVGSFYYFQKASVLVILVRWVENCINVLLSS